MFDNYERYDKIQKEQEKERRELLIGTKNYIKAVMKKNKYSEFLRWKVKRKPTTLVVG